jgi:hypothetical protein
VPGQPSVHTPPSGARGNGKLYPQIGNQPLGIFDRQLNAKRTLFSSQNEDNDPFVELMMSCLLVLKSMNLHSFLAVSVPALFKVRSPKQL